MKQNAIVAGIDIGGTNIVFGLADSSGKILTHQHLLTKQFASAEDMAVAISDSIRKNLQTLGAQYQLAGVGIGAPNSNYYHGTIEHPPNLPWKGIIPLSEYFKKALQVEVAITNDANAAAIGEMIYGGAKDMRDFILITLGTGLGSGLVANGEMIYGHDGFAGELGHVIMERGGRLCGCGRQGCLETYCSSTGIKRTYVELLKAQEGIDGSDIDSHDIYQKAIQGDKNAREAFRFTADMLGLALANSVVYTSPQAIFIYGGLAKAGDLLLKPLREYFEKYLWSIYQNKIKILPSELPENDAAILGAASLIRKKIAQ